MKPTLQLLLGLAFIILNTSCQSASEKTLDELRTNPFPSFEEVYTHVNKQIIAPGNDCQFGLAKKADGYYLKITPYKDGEMQEPKFVKAWDAATKKHLKLNIDEYLQPNSFTDARYQEGLSYLRTSAKSFDFNYFYGYPDYTKDLIELMEDQEDLSNSELEMLARAYYNESCDYIHPNQFGSEITATKDLSTPMYEKIAADRIASFNRLSDKSLACYQKIKDKDPDYKTMVFDDLDLKINHDYMNNYMLLKSVKEDAAAAEMLKKTNYKADAVAYAKQLLDDCAQNGVLLTSGDTDTFPLWYVQDKLHYRTDVIVINHSLLQTSWYFDYIKNTTQIKTSLSTKAYDFYTKTYIAITPGRNITSNYPAWLTQLKADKNPETTKIKGVGTWENMPQISQKLTIDIQGTAVDFSANKSYLAGVDLCMLDLIYTNKDRRFYSTSIYVFSDNNLRDYLVKRNQVYELGPVMNVRNWDKESDKQLLEKLQKHPLTISSKDIGKGIIYPLCYDWILMGPEEIEANQAAFELFLKQVPFKTVLESSDSELQELYACSLIHLNPKKAGQFLDSYAPKALKLLADINNQGTLANSDVEILNNVYSCYIGYKRRNLGIENPFKETVLQKKVAMAIRDKIKILSDNPLNIKNLDWTLEKLNRMKTEMNTF